MNNLFILGCPRSGTSMVTGLFKNSGFYERPTFEGNEGNPDGNFECLDSMIINETLLVPHTPKPYSFFKINYGMDTPKNRQRFLSRIPIDVKIEISDKTENGLKEFVSHTPFCLKDPRLCYTLDIWRKYADGKFIAVFRDIGDVVESILTECKRHTFLHDLSISVNQAAEVWFYMNLHILEKHSKTGEWLFLYYNDVLNGRCFDTIEKFTGVKVDRNFPKKEYNRSKSNIIFSGGVEEVWKRLMEKKQID